MKPEIVKVEDGKVYYSDGSIRWAAGSTEGKPGALIKRGNLGNALFNSESGKEMAAERWRRRRAAADAGMMEATGAATPEEAWAEVNKSLASIALDPNNKGAVRAAEILGRHTGSVEDAKGPTISGGTFVNIVVDPEVLEGISQRAKLFKKEDIVEGEIVDHDRTTSAS